MANFVLKIIDFGDGAHRVEVSSQVGYVAGKTLPYDLQVKADSFRPTTWNVWFGVKNIAEVEPGLWEDSNYVGVIVAYEAIGMKELTLVSRPGGTDARFDVLYYKEEEKKTLATDTTRYTWKSTTMSWLLPVGLAAALGLLIVIKKK